MYIQNVYIFNNGWFCLHIFFVNEIFTCTKKVLPVKKNGRRQDMCYISNFKDNINTCGGSISILHKSTKLGPYIILLVLMSARYQYM